MNDFLRDAAQKPAPDPCKAMAGDDHQIYRLLIQDGKDTHGWMPHNNLRIEKDSCQIVAQTNLFTIRFGAVQAALNGIWREHRVIAP